MAQQRQSNRDQDQQQVPRNSFQNERSTDDEETLRPGAAQADEQQEDEEEIQPSRGRNIDSAGEQDDDV
jgi:hypothetical protein